MSWSARALTLALCAAALPAAAQEWTYYSLHPGGLGESAGQATRGRGLTVGFAGSDDGADHRAAIWTGLSPGDFIDVHPGGFDGSRINRTSGSQHVGHTVLDGVIRAALWNGNAADSYVGLHPAGMRMSYALGTDGERQVGFAETSEGVARAYLWSGSAGSAVSLHPDDAGHSYAYDIGGGRQVGFVEDPFTGSSGGYWEGAAESWTPLHAPQSDFAGSFTNCISPDGTQQGGYALSRVSGTNWAAIWEGSTDTFRSLHPDPDLLGSTLLDTDGTHQVGYIINFGQFAAIWNGTAESYFDLHSVLPHFYQYSNAFGVYSDDEGVWVAGRATNTRDGRLEAIVWHLPVPSPPSALALGAGVLLMRRLR